MVLAAGRVWDAAKNIAMLAAIAPEISGPVVVAGELAAPYGAQTSLPSVILLGAVEPACLSEWYAKAAIYALPARYEPFGLTALEAALSGCALVLGDIDSLHEVWGPAACYVSPDRRAEWRDTVNDLLTDEVSRARLSAAAMARARHFAPARLARRYLSLYRKVCGRPRLLPARAQHVRRDPTSIA
jgi:glycosyltransferase involved in cell wall biosynthesis